MKTLSIFIVWALLPIISFAQPKGVYLGAQFGIGKAKLKNSDLPDQSGKMAVGGGLAVNYQLTKSIGLYGNLLFVSKGTKLTSSETVSGSTTCSYDQHTSFYSIELPLMPKLSYGIKNFYFKVFAGPSINFNVVSKENKVYSESAYDQELGYTSKDIDSPVLEYSYVWGGGLDIFASERNVFYLEGRKQSDMGINRWILLDRNHYFNKYFLISVGYVYKL